MTFEKILYVMCLFLISCQSIKHENINYKYIVYKYHYNVSSKKTKIKTDTIQIRHGSIFISGEWVSNFEVTLHNHDKGYYHFVDNKGRRECKYYYSRNLFLVDTIYYDQYRNNIKTKKLTDKYGTL